MNDNPDKVRCVLRWYTQIFAFFMGPLMFSSSLAGSIWCLLSLKYPDNLVGLILIAVAAFFGYLMGLTNVFIELDGDALRVKSYWTRWETVRSVSDISEILPLVGLAPDVTTAVIDGMFGKVRGYEIRFVQGGRSISLVRPDMSGVDDMIQALAERGKHVTWPSNRPIK